MNKDTLTGLVIGVVIGAFAFWSVIAIINHGKQLTNLNQRTVVLENILGRAIQQQKELEARKMQQPTQVPTTPASKK